MKSILVFRIGSLGDTLAAVPSLWAMKDNFPDVRITLLADQHVGSDRISAHAVLDGSGLVDRFIEYPAGGSRVASAVGAIQLLRRLRSETFDAVAYLAPSYRMARQIARDRRIFRLSGIPRFMGMEGFAPMSARASGIPMPAVAHEADQLLARLSLDGLRVPEPGRGNMDIQLGQEESNQVARWKKSLPSDGSRPWIGVGIGGKQPVNLWPLERYQEVVTRLIERFDIWPVIFGGDAEREPGNSLVARWGRGFNAAGELSARAAMLAMRSCKIFVGNDTGTIHMAAAVGVRCMGIYSSREAPGIWFPYGAGHRVLRTSIECEGCRLSECIERRRECILRIQPAEVIEACGEILCATSSGPLAPVLRGEG